MLAKKAFYHLSLALVLFLNVKLALHFWDKPE
jgi:hypothetical protein